MIKKMLIFEIKKPVDYEKVVEHGDNVNILTELAKNGNADAICRLGVMWYEGKFEESGVLKKSKETQLKMAEYLFSYILENGEANYYLYKLCNGNNFQHLEYLQKSSDLNFGMGRKELAKCYRLGSWELGKNEEKVFELISPYINDKIEEIFEKTIAEIFEQFKEYIIGESYIHNFSSIATRKIIEQNLQHKWYFSELVINPNINEQFLEQYFRNEYEEIREEERKKELKAKIKEEEQKKEEYIDYERILDYYDISAENKIKSIADCNGDTVLKFDSDFFYNISSSPKITFALYEKYINKRWNMWWISKNEEISPEFLIKNHRLEDITGIYYHPKLTPYLVEKYKDKKWNLQLLTPNENFPIMFFEEYIKTQKWTQGLSLRKDLFPHFVLKHKNAVWCWHELARNENFPIIFFEEHFKNKNIFQGLSHRKDINADFIKSHINNGWDWRILAKNENLPLDLFCREWSLLNHSLCGLVKNPNLTLIFIDENITLDWPWEYLQKRFNITESFAEENRDMICVWKMLSYNEYVNIEFIRKNVKKPWNWLPLGGNLTLDFIVEYPEKKYNLRVIFTPEKAIKLKKKNKTRYNK